MIYVVATWVVSTSYDANLVNMIPRAMLTNNDQLFLNGTYYNDTAGTQFQALVSLTSGSFSIFRGGSQITGATFRIFAI